MAWLALACCAAPSIASAADLLRGHLAVGYAKLLNRGAPGGSMMVGAGVDLPVRGTLRAGADVGFALLGSRIVERGSLAADLDYSLFEAVAFAHWKPPDGPLRVSLGPGLFHVRADLSSSGPAAFSDLAVEETAPGAALGVTLMTRRESLLRAGFELGVRAVWLPDGTWTVALGRLTVHY